MQFSTNIAQLFILKHIHMQEFVQHRIDKTGISQEQANMVIHAIKGFVQQKAPMMNGAVDQLLGGEPQAGAEAPASGIQEGLGSITGKLGGFFGS